MIGKLKQIYKRQAFHPNWLGIFINPFYFARSRLNWSIKEFAPRLEGKLLDIGCGTKPYQEFFSKAETYSGLEIDSEKSRKSGIADFFYDGKKFPFPDTSFNALLCNQVLEHVFNPDDFLQEANRILQPKGRLLLTIPFVWDEHEQPYDYARYSSFGLKALLEKSGFDILEHRKLCADATVLFQLTNAYLFKISMHWPKYLRLFFTITVMAFVNLSGVVISKLLPKNPDLFLDHIVLAEKRL